MRQGLRGHPTFLAVISMQVCLWVLLVHCWMGYATLTERPGIRYTLYLFSGITKTQYTAYNFIVAFAALQMMAFQVYFLIEKKTKCLTYCFVGTILMGVGIYLMEVFLKLSFKPKG